VQNFNSGKKICPIHSAYLNEVQTRKRSENLEAKNEFKRSCYSSRQNTEIPERKMEKKTTESI
jgi:uncharacterized Zn finger protein (UPF0148 family)